MSVLYGSSFQYSDGELRKNQDFMDLNSQNFYDNPHHHQQNQHNSGLSRYRTAPSSFFDSLVTSTNGVSGNGGEDYRFFRSSNLEMDQVERFMSSDNGSGGSHSHGLQEFEGDRPAAAIKQEVTDRDMVFQQSFQAQNLGSMSGGNSLDRPFGVVGLEGSMNSVQATKLGSANGSNLVRQNSCSAGFFSSLGVDNGFSAIRDVGSFKASNGTNGETSPSPTRLSSHLSFSAGPGFLPQIGDESVGATSPHATTRKRQYMSSFQNDSWDDASLNSPKRIRDNEGNMFSGLSTLDNQNAGHRVTGLTHHLSLPKTVAEMATMEKFLQFQGSVPCKIRAKRGCATHPRSIAERVRRTRISERMRKLQDLFPNMDKQTNTADMLELAVEYIKDLQNQVKALTDTKARCTCSSTHKPYSSASA